MHGARVDPARVDKSPGSAVLNDPRFADLPLMIETAKAKGSEKPGAIVADAYDLKNLELLRRLRGTPRTRPARAAAASMKG